MTDTHRAAELPAGHERAVDYRRGESCGLDHTTSDLDGYRVLRTIGTDGRVLASPEVIAEIDGAGRYLAALEVARAHREVRGEWAIVDDRHTCGHYSRDVEGDVEPDAPVTG